MDSGAAQEYDVFTSTLSGSSDSASAVGWLGDAGTSAASPIWAGLIAIADQGRALDGGTPLTGYTQTLPALYSLPSADFHDIVYGNNGDPAGPGYDLATGLGTPVANLLVPALAGYDLASQMTIQTEPPSSVVAGGTVRPDRPGRGQPGECGQRRHRDGRPGEQPGRRDPGRHPHGDGRQRRRHLLRPDPEPARHRLHPDSDRQRHRGRPRRRPRSPSRRAATPPRSRVTATPAAPVFGQAVTLDATVGVISPGTGVPTGTVTFEEGSTILGTATLIDGVAQISTTPSAAGTETITVAYGGDDQPSSVEFPLTVGQAAATLDLGGLNVTYDGSPHAAVVSTSPGGLSGVTLTYSRGRRAPWPTRPRPGTTR